MNLIKSGVILLPGLLLSLSLFAQNDIPAFGKVDKADLEMKQCPFDAAAEAMVLFDVAEVYCFLNFNAMLVPLRSQMERNVRIKILNSKGLDFANIHIPFIAENDIETIRNISAQTINQDASGNLIFSKVDKNSIYTKKMNKHFSEIIFAFPDVKVGSIIEYKYKDEAAELYAMKNWFFQRTIPVRLSSYSLNSPSELKMSARLQGELPVKSKESIEPGRNVKTYSLTNIPAFIEEPYISCKEDYLQQVVPYLLSVDIPGLPTQNLKRTWSSVIKTMMQDEDFGVQLSKNIPHTGELDALLVNISDPYKKMCIIHEYVKKNMLWNNMYGIWASDGVKAAWKDKKGSSSEINLILVNLLKEAGIEAHPILVSTRNNGRVNISLPGYDQFNKVIAYVSMNGKIYFLDATDKFTPVRLIPLNVLYSVGLMIDKYDSYQWGWKVIEDNIHQFNNSTLINASIDENGQISGEAQIYSVDYSRLERMPVLVKGKEKFIETYFKSEDNSLAIDSLSFQNTETDSLPLLQFCKFRQKVNNAAGYNYFSANLFLGLDKNPFIADHRFSDILFGAGQSYIIVANFTIPPGFSFTVQPEDIKMRLPDTSIIFSRVTSIQDRKLSVMIELEFKKPMYTTGEYEMFHEFYKKLFTVLNEQFVFKKNQ